MVRRDDDKIDVHKCCPVNFWIVESDLGVRNCQRRAPVTLPGTTTKSYYRWRPEFWPSDHSQAETPVVKAPTTFRIVEGLPSELDPTACPHPFPTVHNHSSTLDHIRLLEDGSLAHQLVIGGENDGLPIQPMSSLIIYGPNKYCVDDLFITHNKSLGVASQQISGVYDFAYICIDDQLSLTSIMSRYVYPVGLGVAMACLIVAFLLYTFLPQLRDLSGKFILCISAFMTACLSLLIVMHVGDFDSNVQMHVTEFLMHATLVGIWLSLNTMGHHIWTIIVSDSTTPSFRSTVSDGRRLSYYLSYIVCLFLAISVSAACLEMKFANSLPLSALFMGSSRLTLECLTVFYAPIGVLLLANLYFYLSAQHKLIRKLVYNRTIQHFQINFDLFTKLFLVITCWSLCLVLAISTSNIFLTVVSQLFNVAIGPIMFVVTLCRTRVAFLFKNYFCNTTCFPGCCPPMTDDFSDRYNDYVDDCFLDSKNCREMAVIDSLAAKSQFDDNRLGRGGRQLRSGHKGKLFTLPSLKSPSSGKYIAVNDLNNNGRSCDQTGSPMDSLAQPFSNLLLSTSRRSTPATDMLTTEGGEEISYLTDTSNQSHDFEDMSKSLFNVRHNPNVGSIAPPSDPEMPVGRIKKLLKSNSLTALNNINFGWRRETSV